MTESSCDGILLERIEREVAAMREEIMQHRGRRLIWSVAQTALELTKTADNLTELKYDQWSQRAGYSLEVTSSQPENRESKTYVKSTWF